MSRPPACKKHRTYQGKRAPQPNTKCPACDAIWAYTQSTPTIEEALRELTKELRDVLLNLDSGSHCCCNSGEYLYSYTVESLEEKLNRAEKALAAIAKKE